MKKRLKFYRAEPYINDKGETMGIWYYGYDEWFEIYSEFVIFNGTTAVTTKNYYYW